MASFAGDGNGNYVMLTAQMFGVGETWVCYVCGEWRYGDTTRIYFDHESVPHGICEDCPGPDVTGGRDE